MAISLLAVSNKKSENYIGVCSDWLNGWSLLAYVISRLFCWCTECVCISGIQQLHFILANKVILKLRLFIHKYCVLRPESTFGRNICIHSHRNIQHGRRRGHQALG